MEELILLLVFFFLLFIIIVTNHRKKGQKGKGFPLIKLHNLTIQAYAQESQAKVISFHNPTGSNLVHHISSSIISWGTILEVNDEQVAIFYYQQEFLEIFYEGKYQLKSQYIPKLARWVIHFNFGTKSPLQVDIYFLNLKLLNNIKWGALQPLFFEGPQLNQVPLHPFGDYSVKIKDPVLYLKKLLIPHKLFSIKSLEDYLQKMIIKEISQVLAQKSGDLAKMTFDLNPLSISIKERLISLLEKQGIQLTHFQLSDLSLPKEIIKKIMKSNTPVKEKSIESIAPKKNPPEPENISHDPIQSIKKYKELLDTGAITPQEFEQKKKDLLKQI